MIIGYTNWTVQLENAVLPLNSSPLRHSQTMDLASFWQRSYCVYWLTMAFMLSSQMYITGSVTTGEDSLHDRRCVGELKVEQSGDEVDLTCTTSPNAHCSRTSQEHRLYIVFHNGTYESLVVAEAPRREPHRAHIHIGRVTSQTAGCYSCYQLKDASDYGPALEPDDQRCIGELPTAVIPSELKCVSDNLDTLECDWCPSTDDDTTSWSLTWKINDDQDHTIRECPQYTSPRKCSCNFCPDKMPCIYQYSTYNMTIEATNPYGSSTSSIPIQINASIARTVPVTSQSFVREINSTTAYIEWKSTMPGHDEIYELTCTPGVSEELSTFEMVTFYNDTMAYLTNLRPYSLYNLTIRARLKNGRYWSDATPFQMRTTESAPVQSPIPVGFYLHTVNKTTDNLTVYWKEIPEEYRNGLIRGYNVTVISPRQGSQHEDLISTSITNVTMVSLQLHGDSMTHYVVNITAYTYAGPSPSAQINLPTGDNVSPCISGFMAKQTTDGMKIKWASCKEDTATSYTIYWTTDNSTQPIKVEWVVVPGNETSITLNHRITFEHMYRYAISSSDGHEDNSMSPWYCPYALKIDYQKSLVLDKTTGAMKVPSAWLNDPDAPCLSKPSDNDGHNHNSGFCVTSSQAPPCDGEVKGQERKSKLPVTYISMLAVFILIAIIGVFAIASYGRRKLAKIDDLTIVTPDNDFSEVSSAENSSHISPYVRCSLNADTDPEDDSIYHTSTLKTYMISRSDSGFEQHSDICCTPSPTGYNMDGPINDIFQFEYADISHRITKANTHGDVSEDRSNLHLANSFRRSRSREFLVAPAIKTSMCITDTINYLTLPYGDVDIDMSIIPMTNNTNNDTESSEFLNKDHIVPSHEGYCTTRYVDKQHGTAISENERKEDDCQTSIDQYVNHAPSNSNTNLHNMEVAKPLVSHVVLNNGYVMR